MTATELAAFCAVSDAFARAPEQEHALAYLINAAVRLHCRTREAAYPPQLRPPADDECGVGMSDKVGRCEAASRAPEGAEASGGICGGLEASTRSMGSGTGLAAKRPCRQCGKTDGGCSGDENYGMCVTQGISWAISQYSGSWHDQGTTNPAPTMPERGERQPLPCVSAVSSNADCVSDRAGCETQGGVTHAADSPLHAFAKAQDDFGRRKAPRFERINPELDGDGA
jgi:hypothetical protein